MEVAAYKLPYKPAVDGVEGKFAMRGVLTGAVHAVKNPVQLGGGEIWVDD